MPVLNCIEIAQIVNDIVVIVYWRFTLLVYERMNYVVLPLQLVLMAY